MYTHTAWWLFSFYQVLCKVMSSFRFSCTFELLLPFIAVSAKKLTSWSSFCVSYSICFLLWVVAHCLRHIYTNQLLLNLYSYARVVYNSKTNKQAVTCQSVALDLASKVCTTRLIILLITMRIGIDIYSLDNWRHAVSTFHKWITERENYVCVCSYRIA